MAWSTPAGLEHHGWLPDTSKPRESRDSLLLLELPLEAMTEQLPLLKANWITGGDTAALLSALEGLAIRGWRFGIAKYEPVRFMPWP